ncbi:MAG: hypothetical protein J6Z35_05145 [Lachnospiraceae bacterium]|nr:hypothetical protein [Lachnospiraceae bacterium]
MSRNQNRSQDSSDCYDGKKNCINQSGDQYSDCRNRSTDDSKPEASDCLKTSDRK